MFTHDPYQTYATFGANLTGATPFGSPYSPYTALQNPGVNPAQAFGYGITHPQQLQALLATQAAIQQQQLQQQLQQQQLQNPLLAAVYQNQLQNPLLAALQNPFTAGISQNPLFNPMLAQTGIPTLPQVGQQTHGLHPQMGQIGGLQPQSWVGQGGLGVGQPFGAQQFGGIHPLVAQQLGARLGQTPGINPWGVY